MKRQIALSSLMLVLAGSAIGQSVYQNNSVVRVPPMDPALLMVQAETFINNNEFTVVFTNLTMNSQLWDSTGTRHFINNGWMTGVPGFAFDRRDPGTKTVAADSFENYGTINVAESYASDYFWVGVPKLLINALNITNRGEMNLGYNARGVFAGSNVDLSQGTINMEPTSAATLGQRQWAGYWGLDTNYNSLGAYLGRNPAVTPFHFVTNRNYTLSNEELRPLTVQAYLDEEFDAARGIRTVHAAFVGNTNNGIVANIYFNGFSGTTLGLHSYYTNSLGISTNHIYIVDTFGVRDEFGLQIESFSGGRMTYIPQNYSFFSGDYQDFMGVPAVPLVIPPGTFGAADNFQWTAYRAIYDPASQILADVMHQDITNAEARVEITGTNYLEMQEANITSGSYLLVQSPTKFGGSRGARITSPYSDINLVVPDGKFVVTNLLVPFVDKREGMVDCWSARWTNTVDNITNIYHVFFADVQVDYKAPARVQSLRLLSGNTGTGNDSLVVHDVLHVTKRMLFDTDRLTFATNDVEADPPFGGVNLLSSSVIWANSAPRLLYLTNQGGIQSFNQIYFGRGANTPYEPGDDMPYQVFHNSGNVTNYGSVIHAREFLNSGVFDSGSNGPITLSENLSAIMTNGVLRAGGEIALESASLLISNHLMQAGTKLRLSITSSLDDGTAPLTIGGVTTYPHPDNVTNKNYWVVGRQGITLDRLADRASLLATTISNYVSPGGNLACPITWAGANKGRTTAGYTNNAALGRLILDGGIGGKFQFKGLPGGSNALYVDYLELCNAATNRDATGEFTRLTTDANIVVYFSQAVANGVSVAEKLDGKSGGRFVWLSSFNEGHFSSKMVVYPDGSTNRLNTALVESCTMDSDGDGTVNCNDLSPIVVGATVTGGTFTRSANGAIEISWIAPAFSTNQLYSSDSLASTNWQLVTNMILGPSGVSNRGTVILGPVGGRVTVSEPAQSGLRFYRPRVMEQ